MKKCVLWAACALSAFVMNGCDKNDDDDDSHDQNVSSTDRDFALKASMGNFAEIEAGKLAAQKAMRS